jgi:hypothetical protein
MYIYIYAFLIKKNIYYDFMVKLYLSSSKWDVIKVSNIRDSTNYGNLILNFIFIKTHSFGCSKLSSDTSRLTRRKKIAHKVIGLFLLSISQTSYFFFFTISSKSIGACINHS